MTKKHFIALADAIRFYNSREHVKFNRKQVSALADFCQSENYHFNRVRWLTYI